MSAVSAARARSLATIRLARGAPYSSSRAATAACSRPAAVSPGAFGDWPWTRPETFQPLCPCRTSQRVPDASGPGLLFGPASLLFGPASLLFGPARPLLSPAGPSPRPGAPAVPGSRNAPPPPAGAR